MFLLIRRFQQDRKMNMKKIIGLAAFAALSTAWADLLYVNAEIDWMRFE